MSHNLDFYDNLICEFYFYDNQKYAPSTIKKYLYLSPSKIVVFLYIGTCLCILFSIYLSLLHKVDSGKYQLQFWLLLYNILYVGIQVSSMQMITIFYTSFYNALMRQLISLWYGVFLRQEIQVVQCNLPIHVFWDQEFSLNLKSVNSKFTIFLLIHYTIIRKNRELGEDLSHNSVNQIFFRLDTKP